MISSGVQGHAFCSSGSDCKLCFLGRTNFNVPGESVVSLPQVECQGLDATRVASATYGLPFARHRQRNLDILLPTCRLSGQLLDSSLFVSFIFHIIRFMLDPLRSPDLIKLNQKQQLTAVMFQIVLRGRYRKGTSMFSSTENRQKKKQGVGGGKKETG